MHSLLVGDFVSLVVDNEHGVHLGEVERGPHNVSEETSQERKRHGQTKQVK